MQKLKRKFTANKAEKELAMIIGKIKENDRLAAKTYANKPMYTNPCTLRLGIQAEQKKLFYTLPRKEYCPI